MDHSKNHPGGEAQGKRVNDRVNPEEQNSLYEIIPFGKDLKWSPSLSA